MSNLSTLFGATPNSPVEEDEKLHNLYWNRAELKKEFAELRNEKYRLMELLKEQEGATARVEQKIEHLEQLLLDPEWVFTVVSFYQLRNLDRFCRRKLGRFAEELKQAREKKQRDRQLAAWQKEIDEAVAGLSEQVGGCRLTAQELEVALQEETDRAASMNGVTRLLKGRSSDARIAELGNQLNDCQDKEQQLLQQIASIRQRQKPDAEGLDTETKRSINFMILAFVQQLYLHFEDDRLADMAKEAAEKSVGAVNYGDGKDCVQLIKRLRARRRAYDDEKDFAGELRERARQMAASATFAHAEDAVPIAASIAGIRVRSGERTETLDRNVLSSNLFGVGDVLSR